MWPLTVFRSLTRQNIQERQQEKERKKEHPPGETSFRIYFFSFGFSSLTGAYGKKLLLPAGTIQRWYRYTTRVYAIFFSDDRAREQLGRERPVALNQVGGFHTSQVFKSYSVEASGIHENTQQGQLLVWIRTDELWQLRINKRGSISVQDDMLQGEEVVKTHHHHRPQHHT